MIEKKHVQEEWKASSSELDIPPSFVELEQEKLVHENLLPPDLTNMQVITLVSQLIETQRELKLSIEEILLQLEELKEDALINQGQHIYDELRKEVTVNMITKQLKNKIRLKLGETVFNEYIQSFEVLSFDEETLEYMIHFKKSNDEVLFQIIQLANDLSLESGFSILIYETVQ